MAIKFKILKKPHLWLSLLPGGNLELRTHYFIGFQIIGKGYYSWSFSEASEEVSITPTSGYQKIKIEWWLDGGDITSIVDAGGGKVTIMTTSPHGRSDGDTVDIRGTTDYDGTYTIRNVTTNTFDIEVTFTSPQSGKWFADVGTEWIDKTVAATYGKARLAIKWDFYSMKDPATGEYYKWLNQNDPDVSTYNVHRGHPRWGMRFDMYGSDINYDYRIVEDYISSYTQDYTKLYDGIKYNSYAYGYYYFHPQICHYEERYPIAEGYKNLKDSLIIYYERDVDYTTDDLIDALTALSSPYTDYFNINIRNTNYDGWKGYVDLEVFGSFLGYDSRNGKMSIELKYINLRVLGGSFFNRFTHWRNPQTININMSDIILIKYHSQNWVGAYINYKNSRQIAINTTLILDYYNPTATRLDNTRGSKVFYNKVGGGVKNIGGTPGDARYMQWRYQRVTDGGSKLSDVYFENYYLYFVDDGSTKETTGYMTNIEFHNADSSPYIDFDVRLDYYYIDGEIDRTMICKNVTSDRNDGKLIMNVLRVSSTHNIKDTWKFFYNINLKVVDEQGNPIEGAVIEVTAGSDTNTCTTDSNGEGSVEFLGYSESYEYVADGNLYPNDYFSATDWNEVNLEIIAQGYKKYMWRGHIKENVNWEISLSRIELPVADEILVNQENNLIKESLTEQDLFIKLNIRRIKARVITDKIESTLNELVKVEVKD